MSSSRHAARATRQFGPRSVIRTVSVLLVGAFALLGAAVGAVASQLARRLVTPAARPNDTEIIALDVPSQTITLSRTDDTVLPGRYGLFTTGSAEYLKLGSVLASTDLTVTRKLLTEIESGARLNGAAAFSGWYFDRPEQLQLPFTSELIGGPIGPCPAWLFPADPRAAGGSELWVIQIHGRGATRAEALRAVPLFRDLGYTSLLVSYRNDGEGPRSRAGTYGLGATEWQDVDAAIGFARRRGARQIVLMGWSMGGAIAMQLELNSAHRDLIKAIILDSPVIDWGVVIDHQAGLLGVPRPIVRIAHRVLGTQWAASIAGAGERIPFDRLDVLARAGELQHPVLILHSDDDGFVPSSASHALAKALPDLVQLEVFDTARHTKLWNYDQQRWSRAITDWLADQTAVRART